MSDPKCTKIYSWADRKDAREALLKRWAAGDFVPSGTHWCGQHKAYHLTRRMNRTGKNYRYRE